MTDKDMEIKVRQAFEKATPDVLSAVLSKCEKQKGTVIPMTNNKKNVHWRRFAALAAALVLVVGLGFGFSTYQQAHAVASTVSLDVNPSVELRLNRDEKVIEAVARNADGEKILEGMELKNSDLNVAVNALIGSMLRNGYLSEIANSILVSVESDDPQRSALLQAEVTQAVSSLLSSDSFSGAVLSQSVSANDQIKALAEQHQISVGKAQLISRIVAQNTRYVFEDLVGLSINELNLLSVSGGHHVEGVDASGTASEKGYIGAEAAKAAALAHCGLTERDITGLQIDMDLEDGVLIYEVEFDTQQWEYEYDIDAKTGNVLHVDKEDKEYKNDDPPADPGGSDQPVTQTQITKEDAKQIALEHAAVNANAISDYECELDRDDGKVIYEISFEHGHVEYEYDIDAVTGTIISWEKDCDKDNGHNQNGHDHSATQGTTPSQPTGSQHISRDEAKAIALGKAAVAADSIRDYECELDMEDGTPVYEISFQSGSREYEFEINAVTGEILHWDVETDD